MTSGTPSQDDDIRIANAYVVASNDHDLGRVFALLSEDACYVSSSVGEYSGKAEIEKMMTGFFLSFSELHWETSEWRRDDDGAVVFDFSMTGVNAQTQEPILRQGQERIWVGQNRKITRVEVRT